MSDNGIQSTNELGGVMFNKPKDFDVPKNEDWYKKYALFVASKYNHIIPVLGNYILGPNEVAERWASRILLTEAYVKASQNDEFFGFMGRDEVNNPLQTRFVKDITPYTIFKHLWGNMRKNCMSLPKTVYANAVQNEALSDKNLSINMAKMKVDYAAEFQQMQQQGAQFKPMGGEEFESHDEIDECAKTMQDGMSSFFTAAMKDFLYSQKWEEKCGKMAEYLVPSYFSCVELQPKGKDIEWTVHRPGQCIWDNTFDDELGRRARYQGFVKNMSVPELLSVREYNWTEQEKIDIQNYATEIPNNTDTIMQLNNMTGVNNLVWWGLLSRVPAIAVVRAYFISWDEDNDCETWYQCDYIGNKWVKNAKKCDNITYNKDGSMNPPLRHFIPEMTYGCNSSIIYKMQQISGKITGINAKIDSLIARAKGKVPAFFADKVPPGTTQVSLLKQIASGLVFLKGAEIDSIMGDPDNKSRGLVEVMDFTASVADIQTLRSEVAYWENKLREMASTPLVQLGTQTEVIGKGVQEATIEQSTFGMLPLYRGFMLHINDILNVAAQMKKNLLTNIEDTEKYALQVSPKQFSYFEITKDFSLVDLQIYLDELDQIDEAEKQHIRDIAERQSQIPGTWFDALDAAKMMTFSTKTELINYMENRRRTWKAEQAKLAAEQHQAAEQQQALNNQTQENIADTQADATLANTALKQKGDEKMLAMGHVMEDGKEQPAN